MGASSPFQLPLSCLYLAVVAELNHDLTPIKQTTFKKDTYIYHGSIEDWRSLFLSNPPIDLDPFFRALAQPLKIKKENDLWKSR